MMKPSSSSSSSPHRHTQLRLRTTALPDTKGAYRAGSAGPAEAEDSDIDDDDNDFEEESKACDGEGKPASSQTGSSTDAPAEIYRDFYLSSIHEIKIALGTPPPKRKGPRGGVASAFPVKLHEMLSRCLLEGTEHIVSWQVHGRAFTVHQPSIFVNELMPRYFKQSKMTSFQRQLNLYGFMRKTDGTDRGSYYHELFLRGRSDLAKIMVRTRVKGECKRRALLEPDFYKMPFCPDDPDPRQQPQPQQQPLPQSSKGLHSSLASSAPSDRHHHYYGKDVARTPRGEYPDVYYSSRHGGRTGDRTRCGPGADGHEPYRYMQGNINLPSSFFFLDEEPLLQAPDDSEWTPPPFPDFQASSQRRPRERPPEQMIQPSYYPNIVSPSPTNPRSNIYRSSQSNMRRGIERQRPSPESREEQAEYHHPHVHSPQHHPHSNRRRENDGSDVGQRENHSWTEDRGGDPMHSYYYPPHPHHLSHGAPEHQYQPHHFRRRGSEEGAAGPPFTGRSSRHHPMYFEGQHFEPLDETSLEMYESDIHSQIDG